MSFGYQTLGFGAYPNRDSTFFYEQTSNATNINVRSYALNAGWDGNSFLHWTLNSGVYAYTTGTSPGMTFNGSYPKGVELVIKGYVTGHGGDGGHGNVGGTATDDHGLPGYTAMSASPSAGSGFTALIWVSGGRILGGGGGGSAATGGGGGGSGGGRGGGGNWSSVYSSQITNPGSGGGGGNGGYSSPGPYNGTSGGNNANSLSNGTTNSGGYGGGWGTNGKGVNRELVAGSGGAAISGSGYSLTNNGVIRGST